MKKTIIVLAILLIGIIGFYACGNDKASPAIEEPAIVQSAVDSATAAQPVTAVEPKPDTTAAVIKESKQNPPAEKEVTKKTVLAVGAEKKADVIAASEEKNN